MDGDPKEKYIFSPGFQNLTKYLMDNNILRRLITQQDPRANLGVGDLIPGEMSIALLAGSPNVADPTLAHEIVHLLRRSGLKDNKMFQISPSSDDMFESVRRSIPPGVKWSGISNESKPTSRGREEAEAYFTTSHGLDTPLRERARHFGYLVSNYGVPIGTASEAVRDLKNTTPPTSMFSGGSYELRKLRESRKY